MIIKPLNSFYLINSIENYKFHNKIILDLIERTTKSKFDDITYTDWDISPDIHRPYLDYFVNLIKPKLEKITTFLNFKECNLLNTWFQQYYTNDLHNWHHHADCNFTNVYYVELPDPNYKTELYDIINNSVIQLDVKEGDIVTFPSYINHRSKENLSDKRKTVISFNVNFDITDIEKINSTLTN